MEHVLSRCDELRQESQIENGNFWVQEVGKQSLDEANPDSTAFLNCEGDSMLDTIRRPRCPQSSSSDVDQISGANELYPLIDARGFTKYN